MVRSDDALDGEALDLVEAQLRPCGGGLPSARSRSGGTRPSRRCTRPARS